MLQKAPFFNRIKMWRKFRGRAVFGGGTAVGAPMRGQSLAIINKSKQRRLLVEGQQPAAGGVPPIGRGGPGAPAFVPGGAGRGVPPFGGAGRGGSQFSGR